MYYQKEISDVLEELSSTVGGLTHEEVTNRIQTQGYNELTEKKKIPVWKLCLETFKDPLVIILLIAALVQLFLGEVVESLIIFIVVCLNGVLSVTQTKKAEGSLESLKKLSTPMAKVIRDNKKLTIPSRELVMGDIVIIEAGDYIPADGRIIESQSLKVVEGMLTGESEPILKQTAVLTGEMPLGDQLNMVFSGSMAVYGRATFVVVGTGLKTELGKVATLLEGASQKQTPLQMKLEDFSKKLGIIILILAALIFGLQVWRGLTNPSLQLIDVILDSFMFSVAIAVAAIPEALSSIVTIVLAVGTNTLAKKQAIVRKLPAVETLGSTAIICTDKTGTLTQNKMTVVDVFMYGTDASELDLEHINFSYHAKTLTLVSTLCNDSLINDEGKEIGDPTELALINYSNSKNLSYKLIRERYNRVGEIPFDSDRKLMSTVNSIYGNDFMFTKGAPDIVFSRCKYALNNGSVVPLTKDILAAYQERNEDFSNRALRVLAFAIKDVPDEDFSPSTDDEYDLTLVGVMALIDPPRDEAYFAVDRAKQAGIKTIMITGDHKTTAAAIASDIGIKAADDMALTGAELDALSEEELDEVLEKVTVYARVSPENKIRIVKAWQRKGFVTAMTGDGVNDAPALKQANIGIGMGSGTEVAKDAGSLILVDDNFATIVKAIEVGRSVYANIKKCITYLFAGNLGAIIAIVFAVFADWSNPFTALQLLFINLINDSIPAIALGLERPEKNIMKEMPRDPNESILGGGTLQVVAFRGLLIGIVVIIAQYIGLQTSPELGMAMAFTTLIVSRILQTLPARSDEETVFELGITSNRYVMMAIVVCFTLFLTTLLPGMRTVFAIPAAFGLFDFGICLLLAIICMISMEVSKVVSRLRKNIKHK